MIKNNFILNKALQIKLQPLHVHQAEDHSWSIHMDQTGIHQFLLQELSCQFQISTTKDIKVNLNTPEKMSFY